MHFRKKLDGTVVAELAQDTEQITTKYLEQAAADGWVTLGGHVVRPGLTPNEVETIDFATDPPVSYVVVRPAGRVCLFCGDKLPDEEDGSGDAARVHVAAEHPGEVSPDPENPSGYRCDNFLTIEKVT